MNMGAERVGAQPQRDNRWQQADEQPLAHAESRFFEGVQEEEAEPTAVGHRILAAILIVLATGWAALSGLALLEAWPGADLPAWAGWIGTISAPLILIGLVWATFGRTSRRETERFVRAVTAMRS